MAQKRKKSKRPADQFNAPSAVKKAAAKAEDAADKAVDTAEAAAATANKAVSKATTPKKKPKAVAPAKREMSASTQWKLLGGGIAAIIGVILVISFLNAGGGSGVLDANAWDLPAKSDETDSGIDDGRVVLSDFTGTPTVVNFFAGWCEACDAELPYFTQLGEDYADQVDFVFINSNETSGAWRDMAERHDIIGRFPVAGDIDGTNRNGFIRNLGGNTGMPATAYYDANGNLVKFTNGQVSQGELLNELVRLGVEL